MRCGPRTQRRLRAEGRSARRRPGMPLPANFRVGQAVRIFTGAPVPEGADTILIQEDAERLDETSIVAREAVTPGRHVRRAGLDFGAGDDPDRRGQTAWRTRIVACGVDGIRQPCRSAAAPGCAIIATGDELVAAGGPPRPRSDRLLERGRDRRAGQVVPAARPSTSASSATDRDAIAAAIARASTLPPTSWSRSAARRSATTISSRRRWRRAA